MPKTVNRLIMYSLAHTHTHTRKTLNRAFWGGRMLRIYYAKMFWRPKNNGKTQKAESKESR